MFTHLCCLSFLCLLAFISGDKAIQSFQHECVNESQVCLVMDAGIQVIDITPLLNNSTEDAKNAVKSAIGAACRGWGMFYITNHGTEVIAKDFVEQMRIFFESSKEVKNSVRRQVNNSRGFADDEYTKQKIDTKEIFDVGHKPVPDLEDDAVENIMLDGYNQWPRGAGLENFRSVVENYYAVCSKLASVLLSAIAYDLGIEPQIFEDVFSRHTSFLRLNYYPVFNGRDSSSDILGVSRHTDAGVLTLLMQDSNSALEVYSGTKQDNNDGQWIHVDPVPGGLAINVCDMLQVRPYHCPEMLYSQGNSYPTIEQNSRLCYYHQSLLSSSSD